MIRPMAKRQPGRGRPSKGERDLMVTRLPVEVGRRIREIAERRDWSYSETLAALAAIALLHVDELPADSTDQEELPLNRAS